MEMSNNQQQSELENLYGEVEADAFGEAFPVKIGGQKKTYYKIINNPPGGKTSHGEENLGKFLSSKDGEIFDQFLATIVFMAPHRQLKAKGGKNLCSSCGGEFPDFRYNPPRCEEARAEDVGKMLEKFKFDKASIPGIVSKVTHKDVLRQCAFKTETGKLFDLCPSADRRLKSACKLGIHVVGYDHDRGSDFIMNLSGMNTRADKMVVSPLAEFQQFSHKKAIPLFAWQVKIHTVLPPDTTGFILKVELQDPSPHQIQDIELVKAMRQLFYDSKESFLARHAWTPKGKDSKEEKKDFIDKQGENHSEEESD